MSATTYQIKGRAKVRSLAIAAGLSVAGMAVMGLAAAFDPGSIWVTVGVALAGVGIGLVLMAQEAARKASVAATLNDEAFVLISSRTQYGMQWRDIRRVSMTGNTMVIRDSKGQDVKVVAPPGSRPEELDALAAAMASKLDESRGYKRPSEG